MTRDIERMQITKSTDAQLRDRLAALRLRYDPRQDGGGYPMAQLRELHLVEDELRERYRQSLDYDFTDSDRADADDWVADNHVALDRETDVERYR